MSEKEAKLAAARKRAELLKAKKAAKIESEKAEDSGKDEADTQVEEDLPKGDDDEVSVPETVKKTTDDFQKEILRLQRLLTESQTEQEALRKRLEVVEAASKTAEQERKVRVGELEDSLARREDHVHTLELDISKLKRQNEDHATTSSDMRSKFEQLEAEHSALKAKSDVASTSAIGAMQVKLDEALAERDSYLNKVQPTEAKLKEVEHDFAQLKSKVDEVHVDQTSFNDEQRSRAQESEMRTKTLLAENQSLLNQLSELRTHLISVQDEKFALGESIERLTRALKDAKASKPSIRSSSDVPRARLSKDFDRSISLQDVSLDKSQDTNDRDPKNPPPELQSNISIDLTSWYDKNAGEVIEV